MKATTRFWKNPFVEILNANGTVCAICGATVALAKKGLLDHQHHTSNGKGFLEMFVPEYKGTEFYVDSPAVADKNLITAGATHWKSFVDKTHN